MKPHKLIEAMKKAKKKRNKILLNRQILFNASFKYAESKTYPIPVDHTWVAIKQAFEDGAEWAEKQRITK